MQNFLIVILTMILSHQVLNAQNAWPLPPIPLSSSSEESSVVVDLKGNTVAVWSEDGVIKVSELPLNGNWSMPLSLSTPSKVATSPKLEVDPNGHATIVWVENNSIKAASRPFGKNWTEAKITPTVSGDLREQSADYEQLTTGLINSSEKNNSHSEGFAPPERGFSRSEPNHPNPPPPPIK